MITDKNEVELALRRAQVAVLNPSVSFGEILEMSPEDLKNGIPGKEPLPFSRNVVCVDLEGLRRTLFYPICTCFLKQTLQVQISRT